MRGHHRTRLRTLHVPEPGLVEVAEVDEDAQIGTTANERLARGSQPGPDVRRGGPDELDAVREVVRAAPHRTQRSQPRRVPEIERLERCIDRLGTLEMEHRRGGTVTVVGLIEV